MQKRKITAREILQDIRAGKSDKTLMEKFNLSAQGLQSLFDKLVRAGVVTQDELDDRVPISERTVDLGLFICPACGNIQGKEFVTCPRCGFSVPGKSEEPTQPATANKPGPRESGAVRKRRPSALHPCTCAYRRRRSFSRPVAGPDPDDELLPYTQHSRYGSTLWR